MTTTDMPMTTWGSNLPARPNEDDAALDTLASSKFLPRVQLMASQSKPVMDEKMQQGRFALLKDKDNVLDLTESFECLALDRRALAMDTGSGNVTSSYDPKSKDFADIMAKSGLPSSGCFYGTQYLIWIVSQECFATYFANSDSARRSSADLNTILRQWREGKVPAPQVVFKRTKAENNKGRWWKPVFSPAGTPFSRMPDMAEVDVQLNAFRNPPKDETQAVGDVEARG